MPETQIKTLGQLEYVINECMDNNYGQMETLEYLFKMIDNNKLEINKEIIVGEVYKAYLR